MDLDVPLAPDHPVATVVLFHGLEGSARRGYAINTYSELYDRGISAIGVNFRSCSGEPNRMKVGTVSRAQVEEIARTKMPDLNAADIDGASKIVEGTARSMGITVNG